MILNKLKVKFIIICLPTPLQKNLPDLSYLKKFDNIYQIFKKISQLFRINFILVQQRNI